MNTASNQRRAGRASVLAVTGLGLFAAGSLFGNGLAEGGEAPRTKLNAHELSTIQLFESSSPSVVHITTGSDRQTGFSMRGVSVPEGTGTGFVWDRDGHVVTNYHVVKDSEWAEVTLADQSKFRAELIGAEPEYDLAVLRIDAPRKALVPLPVGASANLRVGQDVFAIGNPFGLDRTLTTGIISGLEREIRSVARRPIAGVIQTDAAINPGNSGGPLLDSSGRLIGVNTAIASNTGSSAGVGFAVPVDTVRRVVPHLLRSGRVIRPGIGVTIAPDVLAKSYSVRGVVVTGLVPDGAASRAGIRAAELSSRGIESLGDVIVGVNDVPVTRQDDLFAALEMYEAGDRVSLRVLRDEEEVEVPLRLQSLEGARMP